MTILLLTDIPPCENYTAGLVLEHLASFLPPEKLCICAVVNKHINPKINDEFNKYDILTLEKPRELALRPTRTPADELIAFASETANALKVRYQLAPKIIDFAKAHGVTTVWAVLQGQTIVRLSLLVSEKLKASLVSQVWDPFEWWLRDNSVDFLSRKFLRNRFSSVLKKSSSIMAASWEMAEAYTTQSGNHSVPVIASLPERLAEKPAKNWNNEGVVRIGMAGQFYCKTEWDVFVQSMKLSGWKINNKSVKLRVLGSAFTHYTDVPVEIEYLGWRSQTETIKLLAECDALYLPYWFSKTFEQEARYSFPSKLITYFASGRPVFCHAPGYASPSKYVTKYEAGVVCSSLDPSQILTSLSQLFSDQRSYHYYTSNGARRLHKDFSTKVMQENFFECLSHSGLNLINEKTNEQPFPC